MGLINKVGRRLGSSGPLPREGFLRRAIAETKRLIVLRMLIAFGMSIPIPVMLDQALVLGVKLFSSFG